MLQAKLPNGQFLFPSAQITNPTTATALGYDAVVQGPNAQSSVDQGIANVDYSLSDMDRLTGKYYFQNNPTTNPFGAVGALLGFPQQLSAGSQVAPSTTPSSSVPNLTWQQHVGFTRMRAFAQTSQQFSPSDFGMSLRAPRLSHSWRSPTPSVTTAWSSVPASASAMPGMYQNQWELGSSLNWVKGRHTIVDWRAAGTTPSSTSSIGTPAPVG